MNEKFLTDVLVSQYTAALEMLRSTINAAPPSIWDSPDYENRTWRLAYHTLWAVGYYTGPSQDVQPDWEGAIEGAESLGGFWEDPADIVPVEGVHTPEELIGFLDALLLHLHDAIAVHPLEAHSGFEWYPFSRLELHMMTIRHTQHHTAQLIERFRNHGVSGIPWMADGNPSDWGIPNVE